MPIKYWTKEVEDPEAVIVFLPKPSAVLCVGDLPTEELIVSAQWNTTGRLWKRLLDSDKYTKWMWGKPLITTTCSTSLDLAYFHPADLSADDTPPPPRGWGYPGRVDTTWEQIHFSPQSSASLETHITCGEEHIHINTWSNLTQGKMRLVQSSFQVSCFLRWSDLDSCHSYIRLCPSLKSEQEKCTFSSHTPKSMWCWHLPALFILLLILHIEELHQVQSRHLFFWLTAPRLLFAAGVEQRPVHGTGRWRRLAPWLQMIQSYPSIHGKRLAVASLEHRWFSVGPPAAVWIWAALLSYRAASHITAEKAAFCSRVKVHRRPIAKVPAPVALHMVLYFHFPDETLLQPLVQFSTSVWHNEDVHWLNPHFKHNTIIQKLKWWSFSSARAATV